jgi:ribosomal protein L5
MKAYTLRLDEETIDALKRLGLKEKKTIREIMLELIHQKISLAVSRSERIREQKELQDAMQLLNRLTTEKITDSIREDHQR